MIGTTAGRGLFSLIQVDAQVVELDLQSVISFENLRHYRSQQLTGTRTKPLAHADQRRYRPTPSLDIDQKKLRISSVGSRSLGDLG